MKLLDFSNRIFDELNPKEDWEAAIMDFLDEWNAPKDHIIAHTSGSTGQPKEILLPKSAMRLSARMTGEFFGLKKGDTALLCLPVNFIAGKMMLVRAMELELKIYLIKPSSVVDLSQSPVIDFVPMTPMQVEKSLESVSKIKTLLIGGAPLSENLKKRLLETSTKSYESYGMTETITHIALKEITKEYFQTLKGVEIESDKEGRLVIQTPYFEDKIHTNDIVEIKNNNSFKWLGRYDNVINSGGIKLFPEQIEKKIKPFLDGEFIITSVPDELLGEKLIMAVEGKEKEISESVFSKLSKFEVPKEIRFLNQFPRTESGKLKRAEIKKFLG